MNNDFSEQQTRDLLNEMINQVAVYQVRDTKVLEAMRKVRRHAFIPNLDETDISACYQDRPLPIGYGQTISQPFIVAYMTSLINPRPGMKILEIGTGSGYQAAILAELGASVFSVEITPELAEHARNTLTQEGYGTVQVLLGDGYTGWPEHSPYDAIIGTCAPENVPPPLIEQLKEGGRLIMPVGETSQKIVVLTKQEGKTRASDDITVRFVPMLRKQTITSIQPDS